MLQKEARVWLRVLTLGQVSPWDAEAFKRWLYTSPEHQAAFRTVKRRWEELGPGIAEVLRSNPQAARVHRQALHGVQPRRRALLTVAGGAMAAAAVAIVRPPAGMWPAWQEWDADFRTATGEQRTVALSGQVSLTLNTRTSVRRQPGGAEHSRGIELLAGEAAIDLPPTGRAFRVVAGVGHSDADVGHFEVRYVDGKVCVTCLDGSVRIGHPAGARMLRAHEQAIYDDGNISAVANVNPDIAAAWRRGELVFEKTRLSEVIADINRYRSGEVILLNDAVGRKPVSGRFAIASLDSALFQLQRTFNLDARRLPGGLLILS